MYNWVLMASLLLPETSTSLGASGTSYLFLLAKLGHLGKQPSQKRSWSKRTLRRKYTKLCSIVGLLHSKGEKLWNAQCIPRQMINEYLKGIVTDPINKRCSCFNIHVIPINCKLKKILPFLLHSGKHCSCFRHRVAITIAKKFEEKMNSPYCHSFVAFVLLLCQKVFPSFEKMFKLHKSQIQVPFPLTHLPNSWM